MQVSTQTAWKMDCFMTQAPTTQSALRYLVAEGTVVESSGQSAPLELGSLAGRTLLVVLRITSAIEQESLHVSIWGSANGQDWGTVALFWFPQKFEPGPIPAALDLRTRPDLKFLEAHWEVNRWGRGVPRPFFQFSVDVQEAGI